MSNPKAIYMVQGSPWGRIKEEVSFAFSPVQNQDSVLSHHFKVEKSSSYSHAKLWEKLTMYLSIV